MKKSRVQVYTIVALSLVLSAAVVTMISCGGSTNPTTATTGTVNTFLSDPPTCSATPGNLNVSGTVDHVYVTITKVEANINSGAGASGSGWQTLVDLTGSPMQVDLMALNPEATQDFCGTLFKLGAKALPPGKYQQIRLYLLANNASSGPSHNYCTDDTTSPPTTYGWNCVQKGTSYSELQLPSEVQTGIKIPSSQITSGGLTVTAGQSVDFNINIDSCASIVMQGNGKYRLKPVLHAGEVTTNGTNTISGKVVEGPGAPNPGMGVGGAIVLLEQPDTNTPPTDHVMMAGKTNSDGTFAFCPVPSGNGNYDVVAAGSTTDTVGSVSITTTYNPSVVLGVPVGGATGSIPLFAETTASGSLASTNPATISGQITTSDSSSNPIAGEVQLSALQSVTSDSTTVNITVPMLSATTDPSTSGNPTDSQPPVYTTLTTTTSPGCATGSAACVAYSVDVPASAVAVGPYDQTSGNKVMPPTGTNATGQATYTINGLANNADGLLNCTNPSGGSVDASGVAATPGQTTSGVNLSLSGCSANSNP